MSKSRTPLKRSGIFIRAVSQLASFRARHIFFRADSNFINRAVDNRNGLGEFDSGGIDFSDADKLTEIRREKIGMVFQQFHLVFYLTAVENIMVAQYYHGLPDVNDAMTELKRVGLKDRANHLPAQLSGGEQ